MNKKNTFFLFAIAVLVLASCKGNIHADFSYTPEAPKAGETITFTNKSDDGETWDWSFGDGATSTSKSPSKIYRKPGVYNVSLRVDSTSRFTVTKQITVYDTIPAISASTEQVNYFEPFTLSAIVYNPYSYKISYRWLFSENAVSDSISGGESTSSALTLFFNKTNVTETVQLIIAIGTADADTISTDFFVHDRAARSLLMAQPNGHIWRQRIYENGLEAATELPIVAGKQPLAMEAVNNVLYLFDAGDDAVADGTIRAINMENNQSETMMQNATQPEFDMYAGYVHSNFVYWTDRYNFCYKMPLNTRNQTFAWNGSEDAQTTSPYYLVKANRLGYYGNGLAANQPTGSFLVYDDLYFWAKKGAGKGIYRFKATDILSANVTVGTPPSTGVILSDRSIRTFDIDEVRRKIYFVQDDNTLWVCNLDGSQPVKFASGCTGMIAIDNYSNSIFWATASDVRAARLATNSYNQVENEQIFAAGVQALGLAIDKNEK